MDEYQKLLFPYAYNILGSVEDAKDAIQEVLLKYTTKNIIAENTKKYLIKGVINQSINAKKRQTRERSDSTWLPEPVSTETSDLALELREMVSYSVLFLLERLNPKERAVFILKEAFSYTHEEIADVLKVTAENSRKLLSRAHQKVRSNKPKNAPIAQKHFEQIDHITSAIREKDLSAIHQLLSKDITFHADGGNKVKVVKQYSHGIHDIADLLVFVYHKFQKGFQVKSAVINHQPAQLFFS